MRSTKLRLENTICTLRSTHLHVSYTKRQQVARNGGDGKTTSASDSLAPGPVGDQRDYAIDDAIDDAIRIMDVVLDLVINNKKTLVVIIVACILGSFLWIRFPS